MHWVHNRSETVLSWLGTDLWIYHTGSNVIEGERSKLHTWNRREFVIRSSHCHRILRVTMSLRGLVRPNDYAGYWFQNLFMNLLVSCGCCIPQLVEAVYNCCKTRIMAWHEHMTMLMINNVTYVTIVSPIVFSLFNCRSYKYNAIVSHFFFLYTAHTARSTTKALLLIDVWSYHGKPLLTL